ncbi:UvrD-helicase domain-containing protein [uncultured Roseobacter sp.]|uniref:UvrD-helicase domain-containing protein n=1 Tax=uncultured Roseobacter sp. TaxID=114847 RepID=UPI0026095D4B|nr:UvrD-helicase domain-containing protein [uncultured Roseobacter sp.]
MNDLSNHTIARSRLAGLLLRLLGFRRNAVRLTSTGLQLFGGSVKDLEFNALPKPLHITRKLGFGCINVATRKDGNHSVLGLKTSDAGRFVQAANEQWREYFRKKIRTVENELIDVHKAIREFKQAKRYPSACLVDPVLSRSVRILDQLPDPIPAEILSPEQKAALDQIKEFRNAPDDFRDRVAKQFIDADHAEMKDFYDTIESNPLTPEQRLAVATDEDATLVLAGAGSGKTSVIVAKAAHLIERGVRPADEILLMAFGKDAAAEMATRIEERSGAKVAALTFHALGNSIIRQVEGGAPALAPHASDDKAFGALLRDILFKDIASLPSHGALLLRWFSAFYWPYKSEWDFKTKDEYFQYVEAHELRTFQGELVRSFEEWEIANWLFLNGIAYEYEPSYEHDLPGNTRTAYTPDFRLTESGVYIEHFGVRKSGGNGAETTLTTAPHVDRQAYLEGMEWKRKVHAKYETILIETYSYERVEGRLTEALEEKLAPYVSPSPVPPDQVFEQLSEKGQVDTFTQMLGTFLRHFKSSGTTIDLCRNRVDKLQDKARSTAFLKLFEPILQAYQTRLDDRIDFEDMIVRATEHVEAGRYKSPYRHLLVDEFQDISAGRAKLLKALKAQHSDARIFAVGDDWQSIYRFTGSDIHLMRDFGSEFGGTFAGRSAIHSSVDLGRTFRSVDKIALPARSFVLKNPAQIAKEVVPAGISDQASIQVAHYGWGQEESALLATLKELEEQANGTQTSVLLLGRYNFLRPDNLPTLARRHPLISIKFMTVHRSKGLEADHVIILQASSGRMGFPSEIVDDPILDLVLPKPEKFDHAEERRLFYVALTRARKTVTVLADRQRPSAFARELVENPEYGATVLGEIGAIQHRCSACGGRLLSQTSKKGQTYFQCEHKKLCGEMQWPCGACGNDLPVADTDEQGQFKCSCGATFPSCPKCSSGWLVQRPGKWGKFLGCTRYPDCTGKQSLKASGHAGSNKNARKAVTLEKDPDKQAMQRLLDSKKIRTVNELVDYVASKGWSIKHDKRRASDGRYTIGIRTAPYEIFRVSTEFDPSSAYLPRARKGRTGKY